MRRPDRPYIGLLQILGGLALAGSLAGGLAEHLYGLRGESVVVAAVYWMLAELGRLAAVDPGKVTPIYPAAGFALTAILLRGERGFAVNTGKY